MDGGSYAGTSEQAKDLGGVKVYSIYNGLSKGYPLDYGWLIILGRQVQLMMRAEHLYQRSTWDIWEGWYQIK